MSICQSVTENSGVDDHPVTICFLKHDNHKVNITLRFAVIHLVPFTAVIDREAGPNLVHAKVLSTKVLETVQPCTLPNPFVDANWRPSSVCGRVDLTVAVRNLKVRTRFIVITQLGTDCILGTKSIDNHFRAISPRT